jgi:uncharacterized RDD family membrane protein YckC
VTAAASVTTPAPGRLRWWASLWDYLLIVAWVAFLLVIGFIARPLLVPTTGASVLRTDAIAFATTVLPVWLYLTAAESGATQATWGKRRMGLRITTNTGGRPGLSPVMVRNAVKLLPWQLAHIAVARLILGVHAPVLIAVTYTLSLVIPVVSIAMAWRGPAGRALHDYVTGTRVVRA